MGNHPCTTHIYFRIFSIVSFEQFFRMKSILGMVLMVILLSDAQEDAPIVNNKPIVAPNSDDSSWWDQKYIESHIGIISTVSVLVFLGIAVCIVCRCSNTRKYAGYSRS